MKTLTSHCSLCSLPTLKVRWLLLVMVSVTLFAGVELWVGLMSHSLTLRADSGHMLMDGAAIGIALTAAWVGQRSPSKGRGNQRVELLAALINGVALLAMAAWIGREALAHWYGTPAEILSTPMLITALLGLAVNGLNLYWLHGDIREDLNFQGLFLHILADLVGSIGAMLAAIAVTFLRWIWADAVIGAVVALAIAAGAISLLAQTVHRLLTPSSSPSLAKENLQDFGWLETGQTDLARLVSK